MSARLTLEGVTKRRSGRDRTFSLTIERLEVRPGDRLLLAGPNGCGKSTLLELIGLALKPDAATRFTLTTNGRDAADRPRDVPTASSHRLTPTPTLPRRGGGSSVAADPRSPAPSPVAGQGEGSSLAADRRSLAPFPLLHQGEESGAAADRRSSAPSALPHQGEGSGVAADRRSPAPSALPQQGEGGRVLGRLPSSPSPLAGEGRGGGTGRAFSGLVVDLQALWQRGRHDELARLRARHMGYLPQTGALLPFLTVRQNIELVQSLSGRHDPDLLRDICRRLDLDPLLGEAPAELSVGQRQRAAIARALVHRPSFVLADEPTAALDPANARAVLQLLVDLVREIDCGLLLVSHEPELAQRCGLEPLALDWAVAADAWQTRVTRTAAMAC